MTAGFGRFAAITSRLQTRLTPQSGTCTLVVDGVEREGFPCIYDANFEVRDLASGQVIASFPVAYVSQADLADEEDLVPGTLALHVAGALRFVERAIPQADGMWRLELSKG